MTDTKPCLAAEYLNAAVRPRTQRVIPIVSPLFVPTEQLARPLDRLALFGRLAPLALEIGCGTGHFVLQRARQQPELDFLAIDIYNKGCLKTCSKLDAAGLTNVRVLRMEARELLVEALPDDSLQAIYINCPDPWPKKRHRERRLVNRDFLELALRRLHPAGELFFSSDQRDYVEQVAEVLADVPGFRNQLAAPFVESLPGYPLSKYMRRFLDQGLPVHFLHHRRDPAISLPALSGLDLRRGYRARRPGGRHE
ncbi:MAG: tRNA (guanosine(46)-N7)-methyltransferase TrmB [Desulfuromonas sp.]|nr:tRNA (guanosine(46)-N7)-methyltransferase TrmB [Desulfuromonas sp.]